MPRSSQLHRNKPLENVSIAYKPMGYIGDELSPKVSVENETDTYYVYSKDTMGLPETIRADGAESNRANFNLSTASYTLEEHSIHDDVTDRQKRNADKAIRIEADTTEFLTDIILRRREVDLQSVVQTVSNWANSVSLTAAAAWSLNTTTTNPIQQIDSASSIINLNSGKRPNVAVLNELAFNAAKEHTSIVERIKYTSPDSVTPAMIAKLFNIEKILKPEVVYNTGNEGTGDSMSRIWNDNVFLAYIAPVTGLKKVSAIGTLWQNNAGSPYVVKKWREEKISADRIEVNAMFQNKIISSDCAYIIADVSQ